jgi:predicted membrane-bound mannosyltransferase
MKPALKCCFLILALAVIGLALRHTLRPMHTDEAVDAIKFGALLEKGSYIYDPAEYHGPTLNYFTCRL